jgi:hypothetical protein
MFIRWISLAKADIARYGSLYPSVGNGVLTMHPRNISAGDII